MPDHVTWKHVASALNARFVMSNVRELTDDNLEYLSHKCLHSSRRNFVMEHVAVCVMKYQCVGYSSG